MPWSPSFEAPVPDPRLDAFRGRAGILLRDGAEVGHALVETDYLGNLEGGVLWWRRWAPPTEYAICFTIVDGESCHGDEVWPDALDAAVALWTADRYAHHAATYVVSWLDEAESRRVHDEVFGHEH